MNRLRHVSLLGLLVALMASACGEGFESSAAVVGGVEIPASEVDDAVEDFRDSEAFTAATAAGGAGTVSKEFERNYLGLLIRIAILEPEAEARDISVTDADVEARIEEIKGGFDDEAAFQDAMAQQGLTLPALRSYVYEGELEGRVREDVIGGVTLGATEVQAYYDEHPDEFTQVRSSHILVEDNQTAIAISEQLEGATDQEFPELFAELAKEHSIDTGSGERGGDLGFSSYTEFVEPFADALRALEVGEVSAPVRSEFGFHIIYLKARRSTPFPEVEDQVTEKLLTERQDEAWTEWLSERYADAELRVNPRYGEFDPETQQIVAADAETVPGAATPKGTPTPNPSIAPSPQG